MTEDDAALYEAPFEYVKKHVKPIRDKATSGASWRRLWWTTGAETGLRAARARLSSRTLRRRASPSIDSSSGFPRARSATAATIVFARSDDFYFGASQLPRA